MSFEPVSPVQPAVVTDPAVTSKEDLAKAATISAGTKVRTLEDLKNISPDFYKKFVAGLVDTVRSQMQKEADRMKEAWRKIREDDKR